MDQLTNVQTLKKWWQKFTAGIAVTVLKLYWKTLRLSLSPELLELIQGLNSPTIIVFWHTNLFVAAILNKFLKNRSQMYGLISPSKDGAWLSHIFHHFGILSIRGSSKRGGSSAISKMKDILASGFYVTITPDGPRGPSHKFKIGTAIIAQQSKSDLLLVAVKYYKFFSLSSWDKFKIPFPFSKVYATGEIIKYQSFENLSVEDATMMFENQLQQLQCFTDLLR